MARNARIETHRQERSRKFHQRRLNTVTLTVQQQTVILREQCEKALEKDALYQRNLIGSVKTLPDWQLSNLWRTLVMRALSRAGHTLRQSRQMCLAYGFQPV